MIPRVPPLKPRTNGSNIVANGRNIVDQHLPTLLEVVELRPFARCFMKPLAWLRVLKCHWHVAWKLGLRIQLSGYRPIAISSLITYYINNRARM